MQASIVGCCKSIFLLVLMLISSSAGAGTTSGSTTSAFVTAAGGASLDIPDSVTEGLEARSAISTANKRILVTGGAGYIGTHTILCLIEAGYDVTVVDNLINSSEEGLNRVQELTGCDPERIAFYNCDVADEAALERVFKAEHKKKSGKFEACIHFAGLKAVGESVRLPLMYYENNLGSTLTLLKLMDRYDCHSIVFSSSATVYGSAPVPITESTQTGLGITNAYGRTKYMIEEILKDYFRSKQLRPAPADAADASSKGSITKPWSVSILRYFNPVGAHASGRIGEDPNGIPNNLMPFVSQVVVGRREKLTIFGNSYPTKDGTGVRDYIHVMDLAEGHVAALKYIDGADTSVGSKNDGVIPATESSLPTATTTVGGGGEGGGDDSAAATTKMGNKVGKGFGKLSVFNLGTGIGYSVLEMVEAMKTASGRPLPYEFGPARDGDIAECYADPSWAREELGWEATRSLQDMCVDLWKWQRNNPNGYASPPSVLTSAEPTNSRSRSKTRTN